MNRKNVIRTLAAVAAVLLLGWSFFYFSDDTRGYKPVDTSVAMGQINADNQFDIVWASDGVIEPDPYLEQYSWFPDSVRKALVAAAG